MSDVGLLGILTAGLLLTAVLRILLAEKKKQPLGLGWKLQTFVFPVLMGLALVLWGLGRDHVFSLVVLGLVQELVCWLVRRRRK